MCNDEIKSKNNKRTKSKRQKLLTENSPKFNNDELESNQPTKSSFTSNSSIQPSCDCLPSKIIAFQLNLFKMLCDYAQYRDKMRQYTGNLIQSRIKTKEISSITTNTDNLHLQTISTQCIICPEVGNENNLYMSDSELTNQLEFNLSSLENLVANVQVKECLSKIEKTLLKQFIESVELLAQLFGFFGFPSCKAKVLEYKLDILNCSFEKETCQNKEILMSNTIISLMKSYLNAGMCNDFDKLSKRLFSENGIFVCDQKSPKQSLEKKKNARKKDVSDSVHQNQNFADLKLEEVLNLIETRKLFGNKSDLMVWFYLSLSHFYILKHKVMFLTYLNFQFFLINK